MRKRDRFARAICFAIAASVLAAPAHATPFLVEFDGIDGMGMDSATAFMARDAHGFEIISLSGAVKAEGILDILSQDLDQSSWESFPPVGDGPHTPTSTWVAQNVSGEDLMDANALIFARVVDFMVGSQLIHYDSEKVGLYIDPADGWVIVHLTDADGLNFYYPTLVLGPLGADEIPDAFLVNYSVNEEIQQVGVNYILPRLALGYAVVPEPGTLALFGLGLTGLALQGRRRA